MTNVNMTRALQIAGIAAVAVVFVLVLAPVQISAALLSMFSTAVVVGAIGAGIYYVNQGMKKAEKGAKKGVSDLSAAVARTDKALRASDKANDQVINQDLSNARHHLNDALRLLADSEFADAERAADAGKSALYLVVSALGITDVALLAPEAQLVPPMKAD